MEIPSAGLHNQQMRINEILAAETPVFSFEFFPPKTEAGEQNLYRALSELKPLDPSFVSVTYGAGGSSRSKTIEIVKRIKDDFGLEAMAHFTCVGATVEELRATLDEMREAGIENVLALRGDPPEGQEDWTKTDGGLEYSRELVALIGEDYPFAIGAACFPETHIHAESAEADLRYLAEKVDAGVDFLITQMFFDNDFYFDFVARARACGRRGADHPGHHADHARRAGRADGQHVRLGDPRRAARRAARARARTPRRCSTSASPTRRCSAPSCSPPARRASTSTRSTARRRRARSSAR